MVTVLKDEEDRVISYCEWCLVDEKGDLQDNGRYLFVRELWIHEKYRQKGMIEKMIYKIAPEAPAAIYAYWRRRKYNDRIKLFRRSKLYG